MRAHFKDIQRRNTFRTIPTRLNSEKIMKFVYGMVSVYLNLAILDVDQCTRKMELDLPESALEFYEEQIKRIGALSLVFKQTMFPHITVSSLQQNGPFSIDVEKRMDTLQRTIQQIKQAVEGMEYYLSVGNSLMQLRDSGERGNFAILCDRQFLTAEWLRVIPRMMGRGDSCITTHQF